MDNKTIKKVNSTEGPEGMKIETAVELVPGQEDEVEQVTKKELEKCPNCGAPIEELTEIKGGCDVEGCSVEFMCDSCAITTECGKHVCREHASPIVMGDFEQDGETTLVACPDHRTHLQKRADVSLLTDFWVKQSKNDYRKKEIALKEKEVKTQAFEMFIPLLVEQYKDKTRRAELGLRLQELRRKRRRDLLDFEIKKESNSIKKQKIEADKQIARDKLGARLLELKAEYDIKKSKLGLEERAEDRRLAELEHQIKKDKADLGLRSQEMELKEVAEERKWEEEERKQRGQEHDMLMEEVKLALLAGKYEEAGDHLLSEEV